MIARQACETYLLGTWEAWQVYAVGMAHGALAVGVYWWLDRRKRTDA